MKIISILLFTLLFSITHAQSIDSKNIPQKVKYKFKSVYSKAINVKWTIENSLYEASFTSGKKKMSVNLDEDGKIVETETETQISNIPVEIRESVAKDYPKYKITEATKIEKSGMVTYETEITKGKNKMDLYYDDHGTLKKIDKVNPGK
jgi:hypothetical protein